MIRTYKPTTPSQRMRKSLVNLADRVAPEKSLMRNLVGSSGRTNGRVTTRHKSRGARRMYRIVDFKRDKRDIPGKVVSIQYDPNRGPNIALIVYADGEKRYILAPQELKKGYTVMSGEKIEALVGNALPLGNIPLGTFVHNIELNPGAGGKIARGAGNSALIMAKEGNFVNLKLPSGEVKKVSVLCYATVGALNNEDLRNTRLGKAGRNRHKGVRPTVRGVAMGNPGDHPHGGSYKTTGIGRKFPQSPWGWNARGVRTRRRKLTDYTIVQKRKGR